MDVFRIEKQKYLSTLLLGIPGKEHDFRWNTKGHPIIYASQSKSLVLHEKCGNISKPFFALSKSYVITIIKLPDIEYKRIQSADLPTGWDKIDAYHQKTQEIGDRFIMSDSIALFVPSTIIKGEFNVLINPDKAIPLALNISVEKIDDGLIDLRK